MTDRRRYPRSAEWTFDAVSLTTYYWLRPTQSVVAILWISENSPKLRPEQKGINRIIISTYYESVFTRMISLLEENKNCRQYKTCFLHRINFRFSFQDVGILGLEIISLPLTKHL